jgi:hypothetical protein
MNTTRRALRDAEIERLFRFGMSPNAIGLRLGLQGHRVRTILAERGYEFFHPTMDTLPGVRAGDPRWANWDRARRGAAATLRAASGKTMA